MANERRVLVYGRDRTLIDLRGKILELSGFITKVPNTSNEALELIRGGTFDLLVLCKRFPTKNVPRRSKRLRRNRR